MAPICGPRYLCTVSNKCLKSLELLKKSLISIKANIRESSLFDGYKMRLNMEALLTLHVENQHAVTHFKRDTFTLCEYATMFCTSVEEAVKRVSKWAAAYYTNPNSHYKLPTSHVVSLPHTKIPKPTAQKITRSEEAEMTGAPTGKCWEKDLKTTTKRE